MTKWNALVGVVSQMWAWPSEWHLLPLRCSDRATYGACVWSKMLAVQHFYAWEEYKPSSAPFSSGLLSNLHTCRKPAPPKPIQITKLMVMASVSNLALVDKFAKQSVTIFHSDIDAKDVRSMLACSPRSTSFSKLRTCLH